MTSGQSPRRPALRKSDINVALTAFAHHGLKPCAMDASPSGVVRWHFTEPRDGIDEDLDRELEHFDERHGQG